MDISHEKLYHELLQMSPHEVEALREAGRQIIGLPPSSQWGKFDVSAPVVHHGHYKRWIAMPSGQHMALALQRDEGGGFFDSLKHGFHSVVKNAGKVHGVIKAVVGPAKRVAQTVSRLPVIGKYASKAASVLEGAEKALDAAEQGIRIAESLDRRINPAAPRQSPIPAMNASMPPPSAPPAPERREFGRVPKKNNPTKGQYGAGLYGRGIPGGGLFRA